MHISDPGSEDRRLRQVQQELDEVGKSLLQMRMYVETLPESERPQARKTLDVAFRAGSIFHRLVHIPFAPPVDVHGNVQLGQILKDHILQTREVYRKIYQLRRIVNIFHEETEELLRSIVRQGPSGVSDTNATQFDLTV